MMNRIIKKSNMAAFVLTGIFSILFAAGPVFADYSGHVASFKSEKNAVVFIHEMRAKGLYAYYQKEDVPGKGEFFRAYIGRYKTMILAQKALAGLKKSGKIDSFEIRKAAEKSVVMETEKTKAVAQKNEPVQKSETKPETVEQGKEPAQKQESKIEPADQKSEQIQKSENKTDSAIQKNKQSQKPENKNEPSIDTGHYYDGIKGIVLNNGRIIRGKIISIDDKDVLKIRTRSGRILSYSFTKDIKEYITGYEP